ncbi:F0F1 ATP synthase subunit epsilon [Desulfurivibrio dismutans]|uniref:F0F1 ATP synthase subunit epsilon n=1 Tax=Desulfurivibrio dismutans TaxID=1398908 RepID=UPI0023DCA34C|nr:F0F1 ATP synthase subunit epsilon [Desulfurivibrio alkaliphilus]MDF1615623.1 F0F1 ATP synthase subunit epsilon [Desulfurivibrio alkaliphilus]
MATQIQLEVVTPKGAVISEQVDMVTAPGYAGVFGVLANHAPLLSTIKIGTLVYKKDGQDAVLMISGGFCEVSNNKVTILVESAEKGAQIDTERALRAKERAERRLAEATAQQERIDRARAEAALQRALARLKAAGKLS